MAIVTTQQTATGNKIVKPAYWIFIGGLSAAVAIALGAVGAHGVSGWLDQNFEPAIAAKRLENWKTAAAYHRYHALGLIVIGLVSVRFPSKLLNAAGVLILLGTALFCGLLYVYSITGSRWMGPIFPIGGFSFIVAWVLFAVAAFKHAKMINRERIE